MSSVEPYDHADEQDASQKRAGEFVEAGCYRPVVLELVEEALDEVALAIEGEVGRSRFFAVGLRRDDGRDLAPF